MKNTLPFLIALCIPLLIIGYIVISIGLNRQAIQPNDDFLYTNSYDYGGGHYNVVGHHLKYIPGSYPTVTGLPGPSSPVIKQPVDYPPNLYRYNVKNETISTVSNDAIDKLIVSGDPSSPDGYTVGPSINNGDLGFIPSLFFGGRSDQALTIRKGRASRAIAIPGSYSYNFKFVAWVTP